MLRAAVTTVIPYDAAILGGGLAGLTAALQLRQACPGASIAVFERRTFPLPEAAHKVGESTVEVAAHYFSRTLELTEHLKQAQLPKLGLRCFFASPDKANLASRLEFGSNSYFPRSTWQLDRGRFENFLAERCRAAGIELLEGASVDNLSVGTGGARHHFEARRAAGAERVEARWLIDATGRSAVLRKHLQLEEESDHKINAVWFRIRGRLSIDEWCTHPEWCALNTGATSRWFSTNHLMDRGYWVWVIPVASGATSFGIVADPRSHSLAEFNSFDRAMAWLRTHEPACAAGIEAAGGELLDFTALKHYSRRCRQLFSPDRWAISGDGGIFIDPLYSPGSDFIAFSNTFITDLVRHDLSGKRVAHLTDLYNELMLGFAENTFQVYQDQYDILGNPVVCPLKIIWDFATYWSFFASVFCHERLCDVTMYARLREDLARVARLNAGMQTLFREWAALPRRFVPRAFIDISTIPYLRELNHSLTVPPPGDFGEYLQQRIERLAGVAAEIVDAAIAWEPGLVRPDGCSPVEPCTPELTNVLRLLAPVTRERPAEERHSPAQSNRMVSAPPTA